MSLDREIVEAALPAYAVGDELGRGAYGIVLAGTHTTLNRPVAIKQLPRAFGSDPDVRKRFHAEARVLASMDHPHIVPIFDFVEREGVCLLVMEHLAGGTLWTRMKAGDIDDRFAVASALAACAGLEYAQQRGVLHRDIKPENLMFNGDGVLKVTDFGIAKVVGSGLTMATKAGYALGTPSYMSPEQAQGLELTPATDVYALGTVLYEVLAGRLPYPATTDPVAALYQHVHEEPTPLAEVAPAIPSVISAVVDTAVARSLDTRYPTPAAFQRALAGAATEAWGADWADAPGLPLRELAAMPPASGGAGRATVVTQPDGRGTTAIGQPGAAAEAPPSSRRRWPLLAGLAAAAIVLGLVLTFALGGDDGGNSGGTSTTSTVAASKAARLTLEPPSGPVGTRVLVTPTAPCPSVPDGTTGPLAVYVEVIDPRRVTAESRGDVYGRQFPVAEDGTWTAEVEVPGIASAGEVQLNVSCINQDPAFEGPGPYFEYPSGGDFTVTATGAAP